MTATDAYVAQGLGCSRNARRSVVITILTFPTKVVEQVSNVLETLENRHVENVPDVRCGLLSETSILTECRQFRLLINRLGRIGAIHSIKPERAQWPGGCMEERLPHFLPADAYNHPGCINKDNQTTVGRSRGIFLVALVGCR